MPIARPVAHLTEEELTSIVLHLFLQGMEIRQIAVHVRQYYEVPEFTREWPYKILANAAARGRFILSPEEHLDDVLATRIRRLYSGLNTIDVVRSVLPGEIAEQATRAILTWLRHQALRKAEAVRIGLMGGSTVQSVCRILARSLAKLSEEEQRALPTLILQALAVGDDVRQPLEDPSSFFTYFADPALHRMKFQFIGIHAPVFLQSNQPSNTFAIGSEFQQLQTEARQSDLVLVSAGEFTDSHSFLGSLRTDPTTVSSWNNLDQALCRGDLGRLPVSHEGPLDLRLVTQPPCTLINLKDFQEIVERKGRVMVIAAPCANCNQPKSRILQTLLELRRSGNLLFSDLVCDAASARGIGTLVQPV